MSCAAAAATLMVLPAGHGVVSVQHLLSQLTVLDPPRKLNVSELITQQLWPQETLQWHTRSELPTQRKSLGINVL